LGSGPCHHRAVSSQTLGTEWFIVLGLLIAVPLVLWTAYRGHAGWLTVLVRFAFAAYVVVIVGLVFTPFPLPPWTPLPESSLSGYRPWPYPWVNIVPSYTIRSALRLGFDSQSGRGLLGNVLAFVPFGIFLPIVWPRSRSLIGMFAVALAISVTIEAGQLGLSLLIRYPYRAADVDDVLLNVLGISLGYAAYRASVAVLSGGRSVQ
jgi:glycopeptide antibiotics resistance protein